MRHIQRFTLNGSGALSATKINCPDGIITGFVLNAGNNCTITITSGDGTTLVDAFALTTKTELQLMQEYTLNDGTSPASFSFYNLAGGTLSITVASGAASDVVTVEVKGI